MVDVIDRQTKDRQTVGLIICAAKWFQNIAFIRLRVFR